MLRFESKDADLGEIYESHLLPKKNGKSEYCCAGVGSIFIIQSSWDNSTFCAALPHQLTVLFKILGFSDA